MEILMNNLDIWKANNKTLVDRLNKLLAKKGAKPFDITPSKINDMKSVDFMPILVRIEHDLGIIAPTDYRVYLGGQYKWMHSVKNHMKLKYLLVTFNNKKTCDLDNAIIAKKEEKKTENVRKILPDLTKLKHSEKVQVQTEQDFEERLSKFYKSFEWSQVRYEALRMYGRRCSCCGATPDMEKVVLHVDHIKPLRFNWNLRCDINNLQILCASCNRGKGYIYEDNWKNK